MHRKSHLWPRAHTWVHSIFSVDVQVANDFIISEQGTSVLKASPSTTDGGEILFEQFITIPDDVPQEKVENLGIDPQLTMGHSENITTSGTIQGVPANQVTLGMGSLLGSTSSTDDLVDENGKNQDFLRNSATEQDAGLQQLSTDAPMGDAPVLENIPEGKEDQENLLIDTPIGAAPIVKNIAQAADLQNLAIDAPMEDVVITNSPVNSNGKRPRTHAPATMQAGGKRLPAGKQPKTQQDKKRRQGRPPVVHSTKNNIFNAHPGDIVADFAKLTATDYSTSIPSPSTVGNRDVVQVKAPVRGKVCNICLSFGGHHPLTYSFAVLFVLQGQRTYRRMYDGRMLSLSLFWRYRGPFLPATRKRG